MSDTNKAKLQTPLEEALVGVINEFILRSGCYVWYNDPTLAYVTASRLNEVPHHLGTDTFKLLMEHYNKLKEHYNIPELKDVPFDLDYVKIPTPPSANAPATEV